MKTDKVQKGLGYQAIKLKVKTITNKDKRLFYSKDDTDKLITRLKERLAYLSSENKRIHRNYASYKYYKKIMEKNKIYSPYDLEKHFNNIHG